MKSILLIVLLIYSAWTCYAQTFTDRIRLNQIGFYPHCTKVAIVAGNPPAGNFTVKNTSRTTTYFTGALSTSSVWPFSNETVRTADFSLFTRPGTYIIDITGIGYSHTFTIKNNVFYPLTKGSMKAYYFQRSSTTLPATYAGVYARASGHSDNTVIVHPSAATATRPAGTTLNMPKGWYDAGDYNSYIVNSGITTYTLLATYEHHKTYWDTLKLNIPESGNSMPDILDEIKWNLDWMLTMQDPADGGVYNKKTNAGFDGYIMPNAATSPRYVCAKGTAASFDFAAVMATAYRIYKPYNLSFANTCLAASQSAWTWGINNFNVPFNNPAASGGYPAIVTGGYGDNSFYDEREWASNELYIATGSATYYPYGFKVTSTYPVPYWGSVRILGLISLLHHRKNLGANGLADTTNMKTKFLETANPLRDHQLTGSAYHVAMGQGGTTKDFVWGSNSSAANQAMILLVAFELTKNNNYYQAALANLDYLLGRNATTYSFVTGFGSRTPVDPHMRLSKADGISAPIPGWLVGGPQNINTPDGCTYPSTQPAMRYVDQMCSYSTNEIAINWNAPLVFVSAGIEKLNPCSNATLPLNLLSFQGNTDGSYNYLNWTVSKGEKLIEFKIEKSLDGIHFSQTGSVAAIKTTNIKSYAYQENNKGKAYYRLNIIDEEGTSFYSNIIVLDAITFFSYKIFPNPASEYLTIEFPEGSKTLTIFNLLGEVVLRKSIGTSADNEILNISTLSRGLYHIQIQENEKMYGGQFIKQ